MTEEQLTSLNTWAAEKCGVKIDSIEYADYKPDEFFYLNGIEHDYKWTLADPRCREVVREKLNIVTNKKLNGMWVAYDHPRAEVIGEGSTPAEAELNCLLAIKDAEEA